MKHDLHIDSSVHFVNWMVVTMIYTIKKVVLSRTGNNPTKIILWIKNLAIAI